MRKLLVIALVFSMTGCGWFGKSEEEKKAEAEAAAAAQRKKVEDIKVTDDLVANWTSRLEVDKTSTGGFEKHEGLTEADPWGNFLKVEYDQDGAEEVMTVSSAGPDGTFGTEDDIKRTRTTDNYYGLFGEYSWVLWIVGVWLVAAFLAFIFSSVLEGYRQRRGKRTNQRRATGRVGVFAFFLAPIAFIFYGFMMLGMVFTDVFGFDGDFFDNGPDFDFDLDIDL